MIKTDSLKNIYLFKDLSADELAKVAQVCQAKEVINGQELFIIGQKAESFFVIQQGTIKIFRNTTSGDEVALTTLASGSHFGEIPFVTDESRTATAQATESSHLIEIPYSGLRGLLERETKISDKFHRSLSRFLANRLKATTNDLSAAKETMLRHF